MMKQENIKLSVLDIQEKYSTDISETIYGIDQIVQWGPDNNAPILYRNCARQSATLKSIIDGSVNYVLGDDVVVNAALWKEKVNRRGMTMRQFVANLALSYFTYGGYAFQIIYNKLMVPVELIPLDFSKIRTNESGSKVWYSKKNWTKWSQKGECYSAYNPKTIDPENPTQIYYFKGDFTDAVYPRPVWYGALTDVLTEIECSKYSLNSVSNGFQARYVMNLPEANNLTDEQRQGFEEAIKNKFCGSEAPSNFLIYWSDDGTKKIEVSKIDEDTTSERYIAIKDNARDNIFISMRATPNLFGLPSKTNFNTQEYQSAFKLFDRTVINPVRDIICEGINKVLGEKAVEIIPFTINFDIN